jgi:hypothetical protein
MKFSSEKCIYSLLPLVCLFWPMIPAFGANVAKGPRVIYELKHDVSPPLGDMALKAGPAKGPLFEKPEGRPPAGFFHQAPGIDTVVQQEYLPGESITKLLSFDGTNSEQAGGVRPPDTNASVGTQ